MLQVCVTQKSRLRPLRLKMSMLRFSATATILCDFARPKKDMLWPLRLKWVSCQLQALWWRYCILSTSMLTKLVYSASILRFCKHKKIRQQFPWLKLLKTFYNARLILRLSATQASWGSMEFRSQKVRFGYPVWSQHESRTSPRDVFSLAVLKSWTTS